MENKILEKTKGFLVWISTKLGINIKITDYLGNGSIGIIYSIDNHRVIKFTSEVFNIEPYVNKNLDGLVKIYSYGEIEVPKRFRYIYENKAGDDKLNFYLDDDNAFSLKCENKIGYIIMEKIEIGDARERINNINNVFISKGHYFKIREDELIISITIRSIYEYCNDKKFLNFCENILNETEKEAVESLKSHYMKIINDFHRLVKIFQNVSKHGIWDDIHEKQFGVNKNGDLVAFDYINLIDILNIDNKKSERIKKFIKPKNLVRETKHIKLFQNFNI